MEIKLDGYPVNIIRFSGNKIKCVFEFVNLMRKKKIDCVYSFLATTNFYAGILGRLCRVRYIIGGIRSSYYEGVKLYIQKILHNNVMSLTISNNYNAVNLLLNVGFKSSKFKVVHNVFPVPIVDNLKVFNNLKLSIISVGRFVQAKDYATSLKSIAMLRNKCPTIKFKYLIIGYGEQEGLIRQMIKDLELDDVVEIKINPNNIFEYLVNSDIYLSTSLFEGTSNSILEALYAALPVVATNVGDNSYMVEDKNGFLVKLKDVEDISDKLKILLLDDNMRKVMGRESKKIVLERFSIEAFAENNFKILAYLENGAK